MAGKTIVQKKNTKKIDLLGRRKKSNRNRQTFLDQGCETTTELVKENELWNKKTGRRTLRTPEKKRMTEEER